MKAMLSEPLIAALALVVYFVWALAFLEACGC